MALTVNQTLFPPVRTRGAVEGAVALIAERIHAGELQIGERLPSERTLASQLEVSRRTLREAIKSLVQVGVLDVKPGAGGGTFVCSDSVPIGLVTKPTEFRLNEISHVLETRRLVEPAVAQLAAIFAEVEDFALMERTIDLQREAEDPARQLRFDTRFHILIARATGNPVVVEMMKDILAKIEVAREMALSGPADPELAVDVHEQTLAALRSRDPEQVEAAMDEHLAFLERRWVAQGGRLRLAQLRDTVLPRRASRPRPS
jgi:GntR family transcriptional repressor for pyruvate dehydrogenase complex